jgi:WD40 repeat protein
VAVSPNRDLVAVAGLPNAALLETGPHPVGGVDIVSMSQQKILRAIRGDARGSLAWSPDGERLVVEGQLYVEIYDAETDQRLAHEKINGSGHRYVLFTPDGRYLIESDFNGRGKGLGVSIWDGHRQTLLQQIPGDVAGIAISRDGRLLAVGSTGRVSVWKMK